MEDIENSKEVYCIRIELWNFEDKITDQLLNLEDEFFIGIHIHVKVTHKDSHFLLHLMTVQNQIFRRHFECFSYWLTTTGSS